MPDTTRNERFAPASGDVSALGRFIARHRRNRVVRKIARWCRQYLAWYGNLTYDVASNGENFVVQTMGRFRPRVIFDAGANVGDWSALAHEACPEAEIHAFEISPPTYDRLAERTRPLGRVKPVKLGLSDEPGSIDIRHYAAMPALTTATDYPHPFPFVTTSAQVTTGDAYAAGNGIQHIDLLKIDVEGMEERVLKGFSRLLAAGAIDVIQFEYGRVSILNRYLLRDFYDFFNSRGYVVGKIFPNYVDFRDYDLEDEDFLGPNYLACRQEKSDYIRALSGRSTSPMAAPVHRSPQAARERA